MTDYKFSKQIKMFSIILIIIGAIGIAFGFYSAPSNVEEAKEIVANMSHDDHGGGHSDDAHGGGHSDDGHGGGYSDCLLYTSPSPRDRTRTRMPSSA